MNRRDDAQSRMVKFIQHEDFTVNWDRLGLDDDDLVRLEDEIAKSPTSGVVIKGAGGARKIRLALPGRGKSGGARVIFVTFVVHDVVVLLKIFAKNEKSDLTPVERNEIIRTIAVVKRNLEEAE